MYSLFSNEKLGMPVEEVRLREIRQEIEIQRLADEVESVQCRQANLVGRWLGQATARLLVPKCRLRHQTELHRVG